MLNKNGERELAYVVKVDAIEPIVGSDNIKVLGKVISVFRML